MESLLLAISMMLQMPGLQYEKWDLDNSGRVEIYYSHVDRDGVRIIKSVHKKEIEPRKNPACDSIIRNNELLILHTREDNPMRYVVNFKPLSVSVVNFEKLESDDHQMPMR